MGHARALDQLLARARTDPEILGVMRFGSTARGDQQAGSDVDVCLILSPSRRTPMALTEKRLEYLQFGDLDVTVFQTLPLHLRRRVLKEGQIEYVKDEDALYELAFRTAQAYEDFKHIYHDYLDQVARG